MRSEAGLKRLARDLSVDRVSIEEYRRIKGGKLRKYRNTPTVVDGKRFESKAEAARYVDLCNLHRAGLVRFFVRQVPFGLPGGIKYFADFMVVWQNSKGVLSHISVEDVKGVLTRVSANKIKQVEEIYGIKVDIIGKRRK